MPEMRSGHLIGLVDDAEHCDVTKHQRQGGERHCQWKKGARLFQNGAKRIGMLIHVASWSWKDVLTKCRPNHVRRRAKVGTASLKKRLELRPVALSPPARIQARKQVSERTIHSTPTLFHPPFLNPSRGTISPRTTP